MPRPIVNVGDEIITRVGTGHATRHKVAIVMHGYVRTKCMVRIPKDKRLDIQPPVGYAVFDCTACRNR